VEEMATTHAEPNYIGVFWWLLALTVIEIAVIYMPLTKLVIAILLVSLAISKAALVGLYFMHLKFERLTLGVIALSPFILCVFLILMLLPDIFPR
jgi:cytochrome c oxidase subunit 4